MNATHKKTKLQQKLDHAEALSLLRECSEARSTDAALRVITDKVCQLVGGKGGSIWLLDSGDPSKIVLRWTYHPEGEEGANKVGVSSYSNQLDEDGYYDGLTGWVFATGKPLCLRNVTDKNECLQYEHLKWSDKFGGFRQANDQKKQEHFMAVPIFSCRAKHDVIGVLRIGASKTAAPFQKEQMALIEAYSGYVSGLLTNYLKIEEERALIQGLFKMVGETDLDVLLDQTARTIPKVMDGSYCSIFLKDPTDDDKFYLEATSAAHLTQHLRRHSAENCLVYHRNEGKTGRVAADGITVCVNGDIKSSAGKSPELSECGTASGAFLAAAIQEEGGRPVGALRVVRSLEEGQAFDKDDRLFLEQFGRQLYTCLSVKGCFARGICFVIMPFGDELDKIYRTLVKPTVECFNFVCRREDDFSAFGPLTAGIVSHIANASFIIADITDRNPNVFYELGIAHTLEKRVILLSQQDAPSDIQLWKFLKYKNTAGDAKAFADELMYTIAEVVKLLSAKQPRTRMSATCS